MTLHIPFDNSYGRLPDRFYARQPAEPVRAPGLIRVNDALALQLGIDPAALASPEGLEVLAGNRVRDGADPLAQAYAGHQFGGWNPQLGDGRAILLGEVVDCNHQRRDIQLKGAGRTPFSRMGDGRAWLGPVIREYLVSEAMHAMGVPTTRALAAVSTGETVLREQGPLPGAVLTRVASSHIRVGTFQYFAARGDAEAVALLADHVRARHYPGADGALELLGEVVAAQARLVADWMALGFIHGVMNTDNCHVGGETIDYGPCAFMDIYKAGKVFSSIDHHGRYAYAAQPGIAAWNLAQFATCLLPLIHADSDRAVALATEAVHRFPDLYEAAFLAKFRGKLGLVTAEEEDWGLVLGLLSAMETGRADFTNTFRALAGGDPAGAFANPAPLGDWLAQYRARLDRQGGADTAMMARCNPAVIPRNHLVEEAIAAAVAGDLDPFSALLAAVTDPYAAPPAGFDLPPQPGQEVLRTFCGT
ncbi:protein adenylyltransferase SelO [Mangrovicoccus algicola]|uniref:Protein nucleotidyltransferase YdiU n=1 Tax=Mangrovicoccus algicola TaxID=2771008 RepID=A0A8J7CX76_9RHOB|nr:YdiU family protein [Mangrovicoccus algicola]MBE3638622.1 YdiU family protein [Mangrovicoccus algicola]